MVEGAVEGSRFHIRVALFASQYEGGRVRFLLDEWGSWWRPEERILFYVKLFGYAS